jgi:DNA-binding protein Fis
MAQPTPTMTKKPTAKRRTAVTYAPRMSIDAFILASSGAPESQIAKSIGITEATLQEWKKRHDEFGYALETAQRKRSDPKSDDTLSGYVYKHLSDEARAVWDQLEYLEDSDNARASIEELFKSDTNQRLRQQMLVHAIAHKTFDVSAALTMVGVSRGQLRKWLERDPDFATLWEELNFHKKNFFEQGLLDLVKARNPFAVIFANKTINADRGYAEKVKVEHSGTINHVHTHIPIGELKLPFEVRAQVYEAMLEWRATAPAKNVTPTSPV